MYLEKMNDLIWALEKDGYDALDIANRLYMYFGWGQNGLEFFNTNTTSGITTKVLISLNKKRANVHSDGNRFTVMFYERPTKSLDGFIAYLDKCGHLLYRD